MSLAFFLILEQVFGIRLMALMIHLNNYPSYDNICTQYFDKSLVHQ